MEAFYVFMVNFNETLFYCSSLNEIMSTGRSKTPMQLWEDCRDLLAEEQDKYDKMPNKALKSAENKKQKIDNLKVKVSELELRKDEDVLSDTTKSNLTKMYGYLKYGKWVVPDEDSIGMPMKKGLTMEPEAIKMLADLDNAGYKKNNIRVTNKYLVGVPDIIHNDYIIDVKTSYDPQTFFINLHKILSPKYWWQMQGYLWLFGLEKGEISYCLLPHPPSIIDKLVADLVPKGYLEAEIRHNFDYCTIPADERRIKFIVERDDEAISKIPKRVEKCREYLFWLHTTHKEPRIARNVPSDQIDMASLVLDQE